MDCQTWSTKSPAIYAEKLAAAVAVYLSRIAILESWGRIPAVFVAALPARKSEIDPRQRIARN